jgi:hypothetical protein
LRHLQHVGACDTRAEKAVAINLADLSDLAATFWTDVSTQPPPDTVAGFSFAVVKVGAAA